MTQKEALDILKTGRSVFLTGAAGSGKTHVLREYIKYLNDHDIPVGITASTGIAATHMGGMTIHAWSGIGVASALADEDVAAIVEKSYLKARLSRARVLIIDEISMLHHFRLDLVDRVLQKVKLNDMPFGGMQVIFCGDFFQLPPVMRQGEVQARFAYHADSWKALNPAVCYLHESHRQNDEKFLSVLHAIRDGEAGSDGAEGIGEILMDRFGAKVEGDIEPTKLYTHNKDVDIENERELELLPGEAIEYYMDSSGRETVVATLKKGCLAPEALRLKPGAKVMFVKNNFDLGYANGTLGVVESCMPNQVLVRTFDGRHIMAENAKWQVEDNGRVLGEISQMPLRLAWAITVHKSQGMSLDAAEVDLSKSFERGMGYVALSRVRTLAGLTIKGMNNMAMQIHEEALDIDKEFKKASDEHVSDLAEAGEEKVALQHAEFKGKAARSSALKLDTFEQTRLLILDKKSVAEIAKMRELTEGTVIDHIEKLKEKDPTIDIRHIRDAMPKARFKKIWSAFQKVGTVDGGKRPLTPVMKLLGNGYSFEELRTVRVSM